MAADVGALLLLPLHRPCHRSDSRTGKHCPGTAAPSPVEACVPKLGALALEPVRMSANGRRESRRGRRRRGAGEITDIGESRSKRRSLWTRAGA